MWQVRSNWTGLTSLAALFKEKWLMVCGFFNIVFHLSFFFVYRYYSLLDVCPSIACLSLTGHDKKAIERDKDPTWSNESWATTASRSRSRKRPIWKNYRRQVVKLLTAKVDLIWITGSGTYYSPKRKVWEKRKDIRVRWNVSVLGRRASCVGMRSKPIQKALG